MKSGLRPTTWDIRFGIGCFLILFVVIAVGGAIFTLDRPDMGTDDLPLVAAFAAVIAGLIVGGVAVALGLEAVRRANRAVGRRLHRPWAVAATHTNEVYVLDMARNEVIRVTEHDFAALTFSQSVFWGTLQSPRDLLATDSGEIIVADTFAGRVVRFRQTGVSEVMYGDGQFHPTLDDPPENLPLEIGKPVGVAIRATGEILVSDIEGRRVFEIREGKGEVIADLDSIAPRPSSPRAIRIAADNRAFVVDRLGNRVLEIAAGEARIVAGTGVGGYRGDGGPARQAQLNHPEGIAVAANGSVFVADTGNHVVRRIDAAGTITTVAGTGERGYGGDGSAATLAKLSRPRGLCLTTWGGFLIADTDNDCIRWVDPEGRITTLVGDGATSWPDMISPSEVAASL